MKKTYKKLTISLKTLETGFVFCYIIGTTI